MSGHRYRPQDHGAFLRGVGRTLGKALVAFLVSSVAACALALAIVGRHS